jgi:hypothetical protein
LHLLLGEPTAAGDWWTPLLGMLLWPLVFVLLDAVRFGKRGAEPCSRIARSRTRTPKPNSSAAARRGLPAVVLAGRLGGWYFKLQVLDHDVYATRSEANRIKPRPVVPGRGMIYDRNGACWPRTCRPSAWT